MRRYLIIPALFLLALAVRAQTPVAGNTTEITSCTAGTCTGTLTNPSTAHNAYMVAVGLTAATTETVTSVADSNSNTYVSQVALMFNAGFSGSCSFFVCGYQTYVACNINTGTTTTPTFTIVTSTNGAHITVSEISGVLQSSSCSGTGHSATTASDGTAGTQFSSGTTTTTQANAIIMGCGITKNGTSAIGTGYTLLGATHAHNICEYKNVTSIGSYDTNFSSSTNSDAILAQVIFMYSSTQPATGFPMVIKYRFVPRRKIPWDDRKRKLEIVRI